MKNFYTNKKACSSSLIFMRRGVTVIELLIVITVIVVMLSVAFSQFAQVKEQQVLKNSVSDILSAINKARSQTLSSLNSSPYGIHFQSDGIIIFKGITYSAGAGDNEQIDIISPATISNVTLSGISGTSGDFYFSRIYGVPSKTGTVTITSNSSSKILTISTTGSVSTD